MNERLTIQDLTDLLAAKHSMTKKDAEAFVKEFFLLIEQALENEKTVKIKGLGTFKLIDVDSRESVNVNTGERFQIKGHTKVSFSPDANLRDTINKPFAHFETVVLNENTILEDTPIEETEEEETGEEASAQAVLNEVGGDSKTTIIEENEGTDNLSEEEPIQEEQIASRPLVEESIEELAITEESAIVQELTEQTSPKEPEEIITETNIEEKVEQLEDDILILSKFSPFAAVNYIRKAIGYEDYIRQYADEKKQDKASLYEILDEISQSTKTCRTFPLFFI